MRATLLAACLAVLALADSGCNSIKCGSGTFQKGDDCVGYDPGDHMPPTTMIMPGSVRSRAAVPDPITLAANEPATVYYTIDGTDPDPATTPGHRDMATIRSLPSPSTVKFFSVDTAGNREPVQTATFVQDVVPPSPVAAMAVTVTGTTAHVTWTNPTDADYAGTALARVTDIVDGAPTDGAIPALADQISGSLQIVSLGTATSFDDPGVKPGTVRYVAWTYDDLGNFSIAKTAGTTIPLGSRTAVLVYDTLLSKLTIQQAPADIDLAMTTASVSGTTLTVSLSAKNQSSAYLINSKAEVTAVTGATFTNPDGTADTFPFKSLGPIAFAPAQQLSSDLVFTTTGTTITINLTFATHPALITTYGQGRYYTSTGAQFIDTGTGKQVPATFDLLAPGPGGRTGGRSRNAAVVGGHFVDVPTTHGAIERFDLATGKAAGVAIVTNAEAANIQGLLAIDGGEIAVAKLASKGRPRYGEDRAGPVEIVRLDEGLHVLQTATYTFTDSSGACQPALSPDGTTLAVAAGDSIALVDPRTLVQIDADPGTSDLDTFVPASNGRIGTIVWLNNNDLLVLTRKTGQAAVVKRSGNTYTTSLVYNDVTTYEGGYAAAAATDGKVWMSFPGSVRTYDPTSGAVTAVSGFTSTQGLARVGNDIWIIHGDHMGADRVDNAGAIQQTITIPVQPPAPAYPCSPYCNGIYGHWLKVAQ